MVRKYRKPPKRSAAAEQFGATLADTMRPMVQQLVREENAEMMAELIALLTQWLAKKVPAEPANVDKRSEE
jgi:hypothetical protein